MVGQVEILTPKCMRAAGLGNERALLVILCNIVHAKILATMKVDKILVRFQSGRLAIESA